MSGERGSDAAEDGDVKGAVGAYGGYHASFGGDIEKREMLRGPHEEGAQSVCAVMCWQGHERGRGRRRDQEPSEGMVRMNKLLS